MRLIDADVLKEYIHNQDGRPFLGITIGEAFQMMVDEQPTIEPKIVRCKDCKHYENDVMGNPWGVCCHLDWITDNCGCLVDENGWCYRAERRTDAAD